LGHAEGAASVGTAVTEEFYEEFRGAIGDEMLLGKSRGAVDQDHQLDDAADLFEVAGGGVECAEEVDGDGARGLKPFGGAEIEPKLAGPNFTAFFFGDVTGDKEKIAGADVRDENSGGRFELRQIDIEGL